MTGFPLALPSAATVRTITPENSWLVVEGRYIGPITAPPGTEDFNRQYRDLAARVISAPPGPAGQDCAPAVPPDGETPLWQQYRALRADVELQALKVHGMAALEDDLGQLHRLLGVAQDLLENPADHVALDALSALLWTLRDKTEVMGWKAGELCKAHPDITYRD